MEINNNMIVIILNVTDVGLFAMGIFLLRIIIEVFEIHSRNPTVSPIRVTKLSTMWLHHSSASPFLYR